MKKQWGVRETNLEASFAEKKKKLGAWLAEKKKKLDREEEARTRKNQNGNSKCFFQRRRRFL